MHNKPKRTIGIDFGLARIGIALSDERKIIAMPVETISTGKKSEQTINTVLHTIEKLEQEKCATIDEIIVGLPLLMSGKKGFLADEVTHFISLLKQAIQIPIITWDERLTTVQAERSLRESHMSRKKRSKVIDKISATIILQSYLDAKGGLPP